MKILVTGSAGFIGAALCQSLIKKGEEVIGVDNENNYYEPSLKKARLKQFIDAPNYTHFKIDICNRNQISNLFRDVKPTKVINLAAQAGVRYSIEQPSKYIDTNLVGFGNILEASKENGVDHLIYASSSSVYGANTTVPFAEDHNVDHPVSIYAATKKANELMAHAYSHLFKLQTTGLRFFTVYGPWDRPDMALQKFAHLICKGKKIPIYNNGEHQRDFTYIDDIVEGIIKVIDKSVVKNGKEPCKIYNLGNNKPIKLMKYIETLEKFLNKKSKKELLPMQKGDMKNTWANIDKIASDFDYKPRVSIDEGIEKFSKWFLFYYKY